VGHIAVSGDVTFYVGLFYRLILHLFSPHGMRNGLLPLDPGQFRSFKMDVHAD
jgi:hypothetical protein